MLSWNQLLNEIKDKQGDAKVPTEQFYQNKDGRFDEMIRTWKQAGYDKLDSVEWINYYPGKDFNEAHVTQFAEEHNLKCARAWVSKIRPGKMAPYHQDIDDNIEEYLAQGSLVRYSVFISEPKPGAVFLFHDEVYHLKPQGTIIKWGDYMNWHAGVNCGLSDKYMFHFLGIKS